MKITKSKLTQLIKEELNKLFAEGRGGYDPYHTEEQEKHAAGTEAKMATALPAGKLDHWRTGPLTLKELEDAIIELRGTLAHAYNDNYGEHASAEDAADDAITSALTPGV